MTRIYDADRETREAERTFEIISSRPGVLERMLADAETVEPPRRPPSHPGNVRTREARGRRRVRRAE